MGIRKVDQIYEAFNRHHLLHDHILKLLVEQKVMCVFHKMLTDIDAPIGDRLLMLNYVQEVTQANPSVFNLSWRDGKEIVKLTVID